MYFTRHLIFTQCLQPSYGSQNLLPCHLQSMVASYVYRISKVCSFFSSLRSPSTDAYKDSLTTACLSPICSNSCSCSSPTAEVPILWCLAHLQMTISTSTKMTVASIAVTMAVMTEAKAIDTVQVTQPNSFSRKQSQQTLIAMYHWFLRPCQYHYTEAIE